MNAQPVDVLAVMQRASERVAELSGGCKTATEVELQEARSAVAELEKRANQMIGGARHREDGRWVVQREDFEAFRAALARVQGGQS